MSTNARIGSSLRFWPRLSRLRDGGASVVVAGSAFGSVVPGGRIRVSADVVAASWYQRGGEKGRAL